MKRDIRIKVIENPNPDLSKLARALLLLVEENADIGKMEQSEAKSA